MLTAEELRSTAEKYGTPFYLFDTDEVKKTIDSYRDKLGSNAELCFAMKANPFLTRQTAELVDRIEVCSTGEYKICKTLGIKPEKLLISGVLKEKQDIWEILNSYRGNCRYTIESPSQFYCMASWCKEKSETLHVYFRLSSGNQFGMDEKTIADLMKKSRKYPFLKIQGLHYFSGTQKKSVKKIKKELEYLDAVCCQLGNIQELEYGPGIPVSYFQNQKIESEDYISEISKAIAKMKWKGKVTLEMGRALTANCGYYFTSIRDVKKNNETNYCITDGGIHQLQYDGQIRGMYQPKVQVIRKSHRKENSEKKEKWTICGSLCTVNDILIRSLETENLQVDDILVFEQTGAYAAMEGMALFLSHELPAVVLWDRKNRWKLIRKKRSTYHWNMEKEINDGNINENFN